MKFFIDIIYMNRKRKSKLLGGNKFTFCPCPQGGVGCYGDVECDCTGRVQTCVSQGDVTYQSRNSKNYINTIKNRLRNAENTKKNNLKRREKVNRIIKRMNKSNNRNQNTNTNNKKLRLNNEYIKEIKNGKKTVEIKILNKNTENIKDGDIVEFLGNNNSVKVKITGVSKHRNLRSALREGTIKRTLPNNVRTYDEGVKKLRKTLGNNNKRVYLNLTLELLH